MPLSTEAVTYVRDSWAVLAADPDALSRTFYDRLFRSNPDYRAMFARTDLPEQRRKLAAALGLVVRHAHRLAPVVAALEDMGQRHAVHGVTPADYDAVRAALLAAMEERLGSLYTPEIGAAWAEAYGAVAGIMQDAADIAMSKSA